MGPASNRSLHGACSSLDAYLAPKEMVARGGELHDPKKAWLADRDSRQKYSLTTR